jgi:hypothetical protein
LRERKDSAAMPGPISRFERSWLLIKASLEVLRADNALLILPVLSGLATVTLAVGFVALGALDGVFTAMHTDRSVHAYGSFYVWLFCWYVVQYFVVIFFNTALVGAAIALLKGERPTVELALELAVSRIGIILGYAVISATVGVLLNALARRLGLIGRLIEGALGLAWAAATFLVVPILAAEGIGPVRAIERSTALLRKTWGENLVGNAGITAVMSAISVATTAVGAGGGMLLFQNGYPVLGSAMLAAAVTTLLLVILISATLSGIYSAAVYVYAVDGQPPAGFDNDMVRGAFTRKGA